MNIPKTVKVGGYIYEVQRPNDSFVSGCSACDGLHTLHTHTIQVAKRGDEAYQNTVLLHELIHAIIACYCDSENFDREEYFTDNLAKGLYQVIIDNPEIFK